MNRSLQVLHKIIPSTEQSQNQEEPILPYGHYAIKHVARAWHDLEGEYEPSAPKHKTYTASRNLRLHKPQFLSPSNKVLLHLLLLNSGHQTKFQSRNLQGAFTSTLPRLNSTTKLQHGTRGDTVSSRQARLTLLPSRSKAPRSKTLVP
jgi:hypothetical protein